MIEVRIECEITGASKKLKLLNPSDALVNEIMAEMPPGWVWGRANKHIPNPARAADLKAQKDLREQQITEMHKNASEMAQRQGQPVPARAEVAARAWNRPDKAPAPASAGCAIAYTSTATDPGARE